MEYIKRENIPTVSLYYDHGQERDIVLLLPPLHFFQLIQMQNVDDIIEELKTGKFANIAERSGRAQDKEDGGGLEELRKGGYM